MKIQTAYLPFNGGSVYGKGIIKEKEPNDTNVHKYVFECERGKVYFNSFNDRQVKGIELIYTPKPLNELLSEVIKQSLNTAAEKAEIEQKGYFEATPEECLKGIEIYDDNGSDRPSFIVLLDKKSITNTFEEILKKFEV